jgi:branched-chain amino acid transport system ATP-binding protein
MLLEIRGLKVHYGKAIAVDDVSLEIAEGSAVGLLGANGAGKSTILKALSGLIPIISGQISYDGVQISGMKALDIVKRGLVHIPEGRRLFPYLTVMNNLKMGASLQKDKAETKRGFDNVFNHFPRLYERRNQLAGTLSGGEQQMLAIGRGLMAKPKLLLMDEPSLGLAPRMVAELIPVIRDINRSNISVLLVEQNISLALGVVSKGYVLQVGRVVLEGDVETLRTSDYVRAAYLGK